jgi:hypothetical protein
LGKQLLAKALYVSVSSNQLVFHNVGDDLSVDDGHLILVVAIIIHLGLESISLLLVACVGLGPPPILMREGIFLSRVNLFRNVYSVQLDLWHLNRGSSVLCEDLTSTQSAVVETVPVGQHLLLMNHQIVLLGWLFRYLGRAKKAVRVGCHLGSSRWSHGLHTLSEKGRHILVLAHQHFDLRSEPLVLAGGTLHYP